jgi:hypothetical protein
MLLVNEFMQVQAEALELAASANITYEEAMRQVIKKTEKAQEARFKKELELVEAMGDKALAVYEDFKTYKPIIEEKLKELKG